MHIEKARVRNFRSFTDSGDLHFTAGFNLIVGKNNSGKSALLEVLGLNYQGSPHRSLTTRRDRDDPSDQESSLEATFITDGEEIRRALLSQQTMRRVPWPSDMQARFQDAPRVIERIIEAKSLRLNARLTSYPNSTPAWRPASYPALDAYAASVNGQQGYMIHIGPDNDRKGFTYSSTIDLVGFHEDGGLALGEGLARTLYRFDAERMNVGESDIGHRTELAPNASNLPEILYNLQGNPARFRDYSKLVREVFPTIQEVSVRPLERQRVQVLIWQVDPTTERDDLAAPLDECGTGISQVLAILYVVKTSERARTILIDEPNSFLHPGAARALIRILKRYGQHQYLLTTHSPEVVSEAGRCGITLLTWENGATQAMQFSAPSLDASKRILSEVGARLSDVFGYDFVVWTEGPSDADAFALILKARFENTAHIAILPLRDTGRLTGDRMTEAIEIYERLTKAEAFVPPVLAMILDRETKSEREIEDATRRSKGHIRFLPRRMIENYVLDREAITALIATLERSSEKRDRLSTIAGRVDGWLMMHGDDPRFLPRSAKKCKPFTAKWLGCVDGAKLLTSLVSDVTEARCEYRKTRDLPTLIETVLIQRPTQFDEITGLLESVLKPVGVSRLPSDGS